MMSCVRLTLIAQLVQSLVALRVLTSSKFDIISCDNMCMQCQDGRNVLIKRQRSGKDTAAVVGVGVGTGVLTSGWGAVPAALAASQLASCDKIGFEFWNKNERRTKQPWSNDAFFGVFFVHSGLEKLEEKTIEDNDAADLAAVEACKELGEPYTWQSLSASAANHTTHHRQELLARTCLSHTSLCGRGELSNDIIHDSALRVDRNPFAKKDLCAPVVHRITTTQVTEAPAVHSTTTTNEVKETTTSSLPIVNDAENTFPENPSATTTASLPSVGDDSNGGPAKEDELTTTSSSDVSNDKSWIKHTKTTTTTVSIRMTDGSRHLIKMPDDDAPVPIKNAGKALAIVLDQDPGKQFMLSDEEIGKVMGTDCRKEHQVQICRSRGIHARNTCVDACCLEVCKYFAKQYPSCVRKCVINQDERA